MPLKLNVGLSKKVGEANFSSRGASVNAELELESALVDEPGRLKDRIRQVFDMIRVSVDEELNGHSSSLGNGAAHNGNGHHHVPAPNNGSSNGNGQPQQGNGQSPRPATQSQIRALHAIAKKCNLDLRQLLQDRFRAVRPEDISLKDASSLIDEMKRKE